MCSIRISYFHPARYRDGERRRIMKSFDQGDMFRELVHL